MESVDEIETIKYTMMDGIEEFCDILQLLVDVDLAILHRVLLVEDEAEQRQTLRKYRNYILFYSNLYNAYTARTLVLEPLIYIKNEIISRDKINLL